MNAPRPIEIVGGGLAGLSLGIALQRNGVPTTILEAGEYPRHRVCGEFIAGLAAETVARLGLDHLLENAVRHREVAWFLPNGEYEVQPLPEPALGISRHSLDAHLAREFVGHGGTLRTRTRAADLQNVPGRVLATGRPAGRSPWLGLKFHVRQFGLERDLELHLGAQAYVGLCRVDAEHVNVCGLFRRRSLSARGAPLLLGYLRAAGLMKLAQRLAHAEVCAGTFCAVAALQFDRRVSRSAQVRLGDACAVIPPFAGNGMAMAFQSAETALDPLLAYAHGGQSWATTRQQIQRGLRARFRTRLASASLLHRFLLNRAGQRSFIVLARTRCLPFRALYAMLH